MPAALRPREALYVDRASARHRSVGIKMRSGFSRRFLDCGFAEEPGKTIASPEYRDATMVGNRSAPRAIQE